MSMLAKDLSAMLSVSPGHKVPWPLLETLDCNSVFQDPLAIISFKNLNPSEMSMGSVYDCLAAIFEAQTHSQPFISFTTSQQLLESLAMTSSNKITKTLDSNVLSPTKHSPQRKKKWTALRHLLSTSLHPSAVLCLWWQL